MNYQDLLEEVSLADEISTFMIVIYKITSPTSKIYIGQTWDWDNRINDYFYFRCKGQRKLYNSLKKYGFEAHKIEILLIFHDTISQESLDFYEIYWWKYYKDLGFNMLNIKEPGSRGKHSEETKRIISENHKRKKVSVGDKNPMYGRFRENHPSFGNEGYFKNWKQKGLIHPMLGRVGEKATCFGRTGNKHPMFGKTAGNSPFAKKVVNLNTKEIYLSAKDAATFLNLDYGCLTRSLRTEKSKRRNIKYKNLEYIS